MWPCVCCSDEDTDVGSLVKSWLEERRWRQQNESGELAQWLFPQSSGLGSQTGPVMHSHVNTEPTCSQHHKHPCFSLQSDFVVDTSLVGTVLNGLSHLRGVRERGQFVVGLIRGLGGNLMLKCHQEFAKEVRAALIYGKCNFMPVQPCCPSLNLGAALLD